MVKFWTPLEWMKKEHRFLVQVQIPVLESEDVADEIRKTTSGQANPRLRFSHYEIIHGDPFVEPVKDEEDSDDEYKVKLESELLTNKLRRDVSRRKGLDVEDEVVVHAEKQSTLNKKIIKNYLLMNFLLFILFVRLWKSYLKH